MAIAWNIAWIGWGITVLGWLLSPIISLLLPKILSFLGFDASQKLQELEIHTLPELKRMLREVEEQRMLTDAKKEASIRIILDKLAAMLKHALYEAEDILDLVEYHRIEREVVVGSWLQRWVEEQRMLRERKKEKRWMTRRRWRDIEEEEVVGDGESRSSSWPHRLYGAVATSRLGRWVRFIRSGSAQLMQWTHKSLCWFLRRSDDTLPVSAAPSNEPVPVTGAAPSNEPPPVSTAPLDSLGQWLRRWSSSLDFNYCCTSIFNWLVVAIEVACYYRNWSYDVVGITSYQVLMIVSLYQLGPAPKLEAFIHLRSLTVWNCSWDALPGNMEHLTSLKELVIFKCLNIRSLPTLPQFLEKFTLIDCNDEFMKSCQTVGHPNWQKIEHIPEKKWKIF